MIDAGALRDLYGRVTKLEQALERRRVEVPYNPACRAYTSVDQSIPHVTQTPISLNHHTYDRGGMHDDVTNNTGIFAPIKGTYIATGEVFWSGSVITGIRIIELAVNGSIVAQEYRDPAGNLGANGVLMGITTHWDMAAGDYWQLFCYQSNSGATSVNVLNSWTTLSVARVGP